MVKLGQALVGEGFHCCSMYFHVYQCHFEARGALGLSARSRADRRSQQREAYGGVTGPPSNTHRLNSSSSSHPHVSSATAW